MQHADAADAIRSAPAGLVLVDVVAGNRELVIKTLAAHRPTTTQQLIAELSTYESHARTSDGIVAVDCSRADDPRLSSHLRLAHERLAAAGTRLVVIGDASRPPLRAAAGYAAPLVVAPAVP